MCLFYGKLVVYSIDESIEWNDGNLPDLYKIIRGINFSARRSDGRVIVSRVGSGVCGEVESGHDG